MLKRLWSKLGKAIGRWLGTNTVNENIRSTQMLVSNYEDQSRAREGFLTQKLSDVADVNLNMYNMIVAFNDTIGKLKDSIERSNDFVMLDIQSKIEYGELLYLINTETRFEIDNGGLRTLLVVKVGKVDTTEVVNGETERKIKMFVVDSDGNTHFVKPYNNGYMIIS